MEMILWFTDTSPKKTFIGEYLVNDWFMGFAK